MYIIDQILINSMHYTEVSIPSVFVENVEVAGRLVLTLVGYLVVGLTVGL